MQEELARLEAELEAEEEEDINFGAMLGELTALLSKACDDDDVLLCAPVTVSKKTQAEEGQAEEEWEEEAGEDEESSPGSVHQRIEELRLMLEEAMGYAVYLLFKDKSTNTDS